jgi:hypothetical protein
MIHNSPGRRDDDMRSIVQLDRLRDHVHTTDDDGRLDVEWCAEDRELVGDLEGEFAAGGEAR